MHVSICTCVWLFFADSYYRSASFDCSGLSRTSIRERLTWPMVSSHDEIFVVWQHYVIRIYGGPSQDSGPFAGDMDAARCLWTCPRDSWDSSHCENDGLLIIITYVFDKMALDVCMGDLHKLQGFLRETWMPGVAFLIFSRVSWDSSHGKNDGIIDENYTYFDKMTFDIFLVRPP